MSITAPIRTWRSWHRPLFAFALLMAVLAVVSAIGVLTDDRWLAGAPVWLKPLKFGLSFFVYAVSMAWVVAQMRLRSRWITTVGTVLAVSSLLELALITLQAARGVESHFSSRDMVFDRVVASGMAIMVMVLWSASLAIGIVAVRHRFGDAATTAAVRWGLGVSVLGAALGFLMLLPTADQRAGLDALVGAHSVGGAYDAAGMPLTGWALDGGDLRIPHFVGIHALQALPLLAAALSVPRLGLDEARRAALVRTGALGYLAIVAITLVQALRGQPLLAPDAVTVGATVAAVVAVGVGVAAIARTPASPISGRAGRRRP
ncbi:hypothetical protein [Pseudonocardia pini]|uniref:hypothetical protein n=1 Tax=Pseudonocardia pini TaxID=2758030 RepID=UPI0015F01A0E|nr:hypothetical protein [Pseudonocardia pini]